MSNENESLTEDLRVDNFKVKNIVKPTLHVEPEKTYTASDVVEMSKKFREETQKLIKEAQFDAKAKTQTIKKSAAPIIDFTKLTVDDVYDLSIPIEAKPFMSADILNIELRDKNYVARWINKNPQRIGDRMSIGFTYVEAKDLDDSVNVGIQTSLDASGHYSINDVVAMKIEKAIWFGALRAAHERAVSTTNQAQARKIAANKANEYMNRSDFSNDYANAAGQSKMNFYDPSITI